eukprot:2819070-Karenia_brevis.AAC.1
MEVSIASDSDRSKSVDKTEDEMFEECYENGTLDSQTANGTAKHHNQRWSLELKGVPGKRKAPLRRRSKSHSSGSSTGTRIVSSRRDRPSRISRHTEHTDETP